MYNSNMARENILRVTAVPPGSAKVRDIPCIESEVANLVAYLTRRGYEDIRVIEKITLTKEKRGELW